MEILLFFSVPLSFLVKIVIRPQSFLEGWGVCINLFCMGNFLFVLSF